MSELLQQSLEQVAHVAPYVLGGGAIGAAIGAYGENAIHKGIADDPKEREFNEIMGEVSDDIAASNEPLSDKAKRMAGPIAIIAATSGLFGGYALSPGESTQPEERSLQIVVDRSFGGPKSLASGEIINKVVVAFDNDDKVKILARVSSIDATKTTNIAGVLKTEPTGGSRMDDAYAGANEAIALQNDESKSKQPEQVIAVITDGNTFGKANKVIGQAKETGSSVFVINADKAITDSNESTLKNISTGTKGKYWETDGSNAKEIAQTIIDEVKDQPKAAEKSVKYESIAAAVSIAGLAIIMVPWRRNMLINRNGTPIAKRKSAHNNNEGEL